MTVEFFVCILISFADCEIIFLKESNFVCEKASEEIKRRKKDVVNFIKEFDLKF